MRLTSDHIAIKPLYKAERKVSTIILPAKANAPFMMWGEVIGIGPGHRGAKSKTLWPTFVKPGDLILYPKDSARSTYENMTIDGEFYSVVAFVQERDCGLVIRSGCVYPLYRRVVGHILPEPRHEISKAGLILPISIQKKTDDATTYVRVYVDNVGFGQRSDEGIAIPTQLLTGDIILMSKWDAWEYELPGGDALTGHVILDEDQVLAIDDDYVPSSDKDAEIEKQLFQALSTFSGQGKGW